MSNDDNSLIQNKIHGGKNIVMIDTLCQVEKFRANRLSTEPESLLCTGLESVQEEIKRWCEHYTCSGAGVDCGQCKGGKEA